MKQTTFADNGFELATNKTRKRVFLEEINSVVPWAQPSSYDAVIEIPTKRLDSYALNYPIKLLKIEAEGCEPEVLDGAATILDSVQYISTDLGFERGVEKAATIVPICNYLHNRGVVIQDVNFNRLCVLFRNKNIK